MDKIKVSAVSYLNTKPFIYGLENSQLLSNMHLQLDIPADCAEKLLSGKVDLGLIPVATLPQLPNYEIISDFCIGAVGKVNSVFLLSDKPLSEIKSIQLDEHSRTSNLLTRILATNYWNIKPKFTPNKCDAMVLIGDRTFGITNSYNYVYDLSEEWENWTGLPFVFAVWAANKNLPADFKLAFNRALQYGINHRKKLISTLPNIPNFDVEDYLMNKISYDFTPEKQKALALFLKKINELDSPILV